MTVRTMGNPEYGIYKLCSGYYRLYKALKDYTDEKEAIDDLIKLVNRTVLPIIPKKRVGHKQNCPALSFC